MRTDWKDDIYAQRKFEMQSNADGTVTPVDKTVYTQSGDSFGALELNAIGEEVNELKKSVSDGKASVAAAITLKKVAAAATDTFAQLAAKIGQIVLGSGNATAADVLAGKTFTNNTGVEQAGIMPNNGAVSNSLAINGTYTVPAGYHNGSGKVTQGIATLAAQTLYPGTTAKTLASASKYMTGNVTVPAVSIAAAYIKKGQVITYPDGSTVTGTWEGYVGGITDIYNYGVAYYGIEVRNGTKLSNSIQLLAGSASTYYIYTTGKINLTAYSGLTVVIGNAVVTARGGVYVYSGASSTSVGTQLGTVGSTSSATAISLGSVEQPVTIQVPFTANHALTDTIGIAIPLYSGGTNTLYRAYLY